MAKALYGFTTTTADPRLLAEVRALRGRVRDLTAELDRTRTENAVLASALEVVEGTDPLLDDSLDETLVADPVSLPEPAYT